MSEEKDAVDAVKYLKAIRKIDMLNEGLLTILLAGLISFMGLLFVLVFTLLSVVFSEAYFIERDMSGDDFYSLMGSVGDFSSWCFSFLLLTLVVRIFVKPFYLILSKRKVVKNA